MRLSISDITKEKGYTFVTIYGTSTAMVMWIVHGLFFIAMGMSLSLRLLFSES
ncbi:MAG: hypothetical protein U1B30_08145 [Pseudomonadota bacterium]|nr:hypothetical protein [Pseudomonadota bacterium]